MGLSMDFSNVGDAGNLQGGSDRPKPGRGMVLISKFEEYGAQSGAAHLLEFEVVAWTDKDSIAKSHHSHIRHKDNTGKGHPWKCLSALGIAGGLFTAGDIKEWQDAGSIPDIDFEALVGRPIMLQLTEKPNDDTTKPPWLEVGSIGRGYYHIQDPRVKDWPTNQSIFNKNAAKVGEFEPAEKAAPKPANPFAATNA
jgi:hypothetical protein